MTRAKVQSTPRSNKIRNPKAEIRNKSQMIEKHKISNRLVADFILERLDCDGGLSWKQVDP